MIDTSKLKAGLWYNPYMKIYSLGLQERVMEVSTYPRAYKKEITGTSINEEDGKEYTWKSWVWAESEKIEFTAKTTATHEFEINKEAVTGQLVNVEILETYVKSGDKLVPIASPLKTQLDSSVITIPKTIGIDTKQIVYIRYNRKIR